MSGRHTCGRTYPDGRQELWDVATLWEASEGLPVADVPLAEIPEATDPEWWVSHCRDPSHPLVAPEMERVLTADPAYPIILHPEGWVMDGNHRVARALLDGRDTIPAVRFTHATMPLPSDGLGSLPVPR